MICSGDLHLRGAEGLPLHDGEAHSGRMVRSCLLILVELTTNLRQSFHNLAVLVGAFNNEKAFSMIVKSSLSTKVRCELHYECWFPNKENVKIFNSGFYVRVLMSLYLILDGVLFSKISKYIKIFRI